MFDKKIRSSMTKNNSLLCVGLDTDYTKLPESIKTSQDALFAFNKEIIDATADLVCAYKPNSAFYEAHGADGIKQLKQTADYLHEAHPDIPIILDAKRADIGNTNNGYVEFMFDYLGMDAVTLHPYLGREALEPFLNRSDKGSIILCRTSNPGAGEFQDLVAESRPVYQHVAKAVTDTWNTNKNCMLVVGATYPDEMKIIRGIVGDMMFLVPGVGAQGGDVEAIMNAGLDSRNQGMIINSARGIIYASKDGNFADSARSEAQKLKSEINRHRGTNIPD
jgi:orotidine-5'-phosphate decarboxylase